MKKIAASIGTLTVLFLILLGPALVNNLFVIKGYNNFITLDIIGKEGHDIPEFSFTNQYDETIEGDDLKGNIYIANFFFTSCPTICPVMTKNMAYVQSQLDVYPNIKFVSHTVDPSNDTPQKMLEYVSIMKRKNVNIDLKNWHFLTGKKEEIYEIAKSYFVNVSEDELAPGGFLHSEYFVLVDKDGRVRSGVDNDNNVVGVYDGTNEAQMMDLIDDVKVLLAEYQRAVKDEI